MELTKIFQVRILNNFIETMIFKKRNGFLLFNGFTLIEMLIVLAILSGLVLLALPSIKKNDNNLKKVVRELTVLGRELRNQARLKQKTYRIVIKMDDDEPAFWVESAPGPVLIKSETTLELEKSNKKSSSEGAPASPFQIEKKYFKGERKLPSNWFFERVETVYKTYSVQSTKREDDEDKAYIHFAPSGLVEQAAIQISNRKEVTWTVLYNPLTGQGQVVDKAISLKDVSQE